MRRSDFFCRAALFVALSAIGSDETHARAVIGTLDDGNLAIIVPTPGLGLPDPDVSVVGSLPENARPHGVADIDDNRSLIADFNRFRVHVVGHEPAALLDTIAMPNYNGTGTIAISPDRSVALAGGFFSQVHVIRAPFGANSALTTIALPSFIPSFATQNIVFDLAGRAYVRHAAGISVIDPPYAAIAFEVPIDSIGPGGIAVTADGTRLLTGYIVSAAKSPSRDADARRLRDQQGEPMPMAMPQARAGGGAGAEPLSTGIDVAALPLTAASVLQRLELFQ